MKYIFLIEDIVKSSQESGENISTLCKRLNGHNETFNEKFPNHNYFDLNFKSLLITVNQPISKENNILPLEVSKYNVSVYPDHITQVATDAIVELNFNQNINFERIYKELERQKQEKQEELENSN